MLLNELFETKDPRQEAIDAALNAIHRRAASKGDQQSISGYAFDIARSYNIGLSGRELANLYYEKYLKEEWSKKYKRSINCNNPRGFSQRAHCAGRKKTNEDLGNIPDWQTIVAVAAAAKMTPLAVKAMWRTAKGAYKLKKFADKMGITIADKIAGKSRVNEAEGLGLTIFDIDETLMRTTAKIKVVRDGKIIKSLTNQEFNNYKLEPGEQFDFGEFRSAEKFRQESKPIEPMIAKLKAILRNAGDSRVIMLTARADFDDKETFLNTFRDLGVDMSRVHVHRAGNLGGAPAENKAVWIRKYLDTGKYSRVRLYDDSMGNIRMFNALAKEYPNVKFFPYLVTHDGGVKTVREYSI